LILHASQSRDGLFHGVENEREERTNDNFKTRSEPNENGTHFQSIIHPEP
jgi:hypothetical protein